MMTTIIKFCQKIIPNFSYFQIIHRQKKQNQTDLNNQEENQFEDFDERERNWK
ncbi:hypothetical protein [Calothrix sp. NIES-3974]|uniref:hypothetical protein n=1 Tax=Calothrix sp. NIES-3974 TaxID=2005462 RepID=UPI000B5F7645|nr:hypothetical protein [Calothrix sp. NIES-3974]BAZ05773.1 hypothetical protein NIES3974_24270 [Calothrix sp. NIES-3974]